MVQSSYSPTIKKTKRRTVRQRLSQSNPDELLDRIFRKELLSAVRGSAILYIISALGYFLIRGASTFFLPFSYPRGDIQTVLGALIVASSVYAVVIYLVTRSRQSSGLVVNFYLLGLLGLAEGGFLAVWGAACFLSAGYWTRQHRGSRRMKCTLENGDIVAFGDQRLVCTTCSKLVKIGRDLPRSWTYAGVGLVIAGASTYFLDLIVPTLSSLLYTGVNTPLLLVLDGVVLLFDLLLSQMGLSGGGYVRLPSEVTPQ